MPSSLVFFGASFKAYEFDISQTNGVELPIIRQVSGDPGENIYRLVSFLQARKIQVLYRVDLKGATHRTAAKITVRGRTLKGLCLNDVTRSAMGGEFRAGLSLVQTVTSIEHPASHTALCISRTKSAASPVTVREVAAS